LPGMNKRKISLYKSFWFANRDAICDLLLIVCTDCLLVNTIVLSR